MQHGDGKQRRSAHLGTAAHEKWPKYYPLLHKNHTNRFIDGKSKGPWSQPYQRRAPHRDWQIVPGKTGKDVRNLTERHIKAAGKL
jgi:hypothetical protein